MKQRRRATAMGIEKTQKILSGRRIPLPEKFMKKYSMEEGDLVILQEELGKLVVLPAKVVRKSS